MEDNKKRKEGLEILKKLTEDEKDSARALAMFEKIYNLGINTTGEFASNRLMSVVFNLRDFFVNNDKKFSSYEILNFIAMVEEYYSKFGIKIGQKDEKLEQNEILQLYFGLDEDYVKSYIEVQEYKNKEQGKQIAETLKSLIKKEIKKLSNQSENDKDEKSKQ